VPLKILRLAAERPFSAPVDQFFFSLTYLCPQDDSLQSFRLVLYIFRLYSMLPDSVTAAAGAFASMATKVSLFPMDTVKTRLQAPGGLFAHGGWRGLYKGVGSIATGSAPIGIPSFTGLSDAQGRYSSWCMMGVIIF
jgi:hypothetical protein